MLAAQQARVKRLKILSLTGTHPPLRAGAVRRCGPLLRLRPSLVERAARLQAGPARLKICRQARANCSIQAEKALTSRSLRHTLTLRRDESRRWEAI